MTGLADIIATVPGEPALSWQPRWIAGTPEPVQIPFVVAGGSDGTIQIWDLTTCRAIGDPLTGHSTRVHQPVVGQLDGRPILITSSDDGTIQFWDLITRQPIGDAITCRQGPVYASAPGWLGAREITILSADDGTIQLWDLNTREAASDPISCHQHVSAALPSRRIPQSSGSHGPVFTSDLTDLASRRITVTGAFNGTVRVWDLASGKPIGKPMTGHRGQVYAPATGNLDGQPIAVTGGEDGTVRVWDLTTRKPIGDPITCQHSWPSAPVIGYLDGQPIVITGGEDGTVRVWDLTTRKPTGDLITGGPGVTYAPAFAELTIGHAEIRAGWPAAGLWRLTSGKDEQPIGSLAITETPAGRMAILGAEDGGLTTADLLTGQMNYQIPGRGRPPVTTITCVNIAGRPAALLSTDRQDAQHIMDILSGKLIKTGSTWHPSAYAVRPPKPSAPIMGGGTLMSVEGNTDGTVEIRVADYNRGHDRMTEKHDGPVTVVSCGYLNQRPTAFTGGQDGKIRVWDLAAMRLLVP
jgi:WD40 repeat protein